jgi:epoxyqueuosine reductase QueG
MKGYASLLLIAVVSLACVAQAPQPAPANPLVTEAKGSYTNVKNNILKAAEKMPEENYSFSPTKEERPFSQVIAHIADSNTRSCGLVKGEQKTPDAESKKTKADLQAALKASFDLCDAAFDAQTDTTAVERITAGRGQRARLSILWGNTGHDMEQYAILSGYMRQKGLVPPSSEPRK